MTESERIELKGLASELELSCLVYGRADNKLHSYEHDDVTLEILLKARNKASDEWAKKSNAFYDRLYSLVKG